MHDRDSQIRQGQTRIKRGNFRGVPFGDFGKMNTSDHVRGQFELAGHNTVKVYNRHNATNNGRKLHQTFLLELFGLQRHVGCAKVHGFGFNLLNAAAGADRLIIEADARRSFVSLCPFRINRVRKGRAGASQFCSVGGKRHQNTSRCNCNAL